MTPNGGSHDGKNSGNARDTSGSKPIVGRRNLLTSAAAASLLGLAGCGGSDSDSNPTTTTRAGNSDGTDSDGGENTTTSMSDQEFVGPMYTNPEQVTFFPALDGPSHLEEDVQLKKIKMAPVNQAMYESGLFANWNENRSMLFSPSQMETRLITPEIVTGGDVASDRADRAAQYTIAEDAKWSDGEDVKARDATLDQMLMRAAQGVPYDEYSRTQQGNPRSNWEEIVFPDGPDGKVVQFTDPWGVIDALGENTFVLENMLRAASATAQGTDGIVPTHISPLDDAWKNGIEAVRNAVENPSEWFKNRTEFVEQTANLSPEHLKRGRDPDWLVTNGAWTLSEIRGAQEVVLEPNPHWRGEKPNFETVRFVFNDSQERRQSLLLSGQLDYLDESLPAEVWQNVPDKYETTTFGNGDAGGIGLDHSDPHLGNRKVRAAMYRALNVEAIANSIHPELATGVHAPGIQTPGSTGVGNITEDWLNSNLIDYSHDAEGAARMMREEGYSKQDGVWVGPDGEELRYELPTPNSATESGSMSMVQGVAQQWSNFGIPVSIRTMDSSTWQQQFEAGEFDMWPGGAVPFGGWYLGNFWAISTEIYKLHTDYKMVAWQMHPMEQIRSALGEDLNNWPSGGYRTGINKYLEPFTVGVPPIGQPDGPRSDYRLYYEHGIRRLGKSREEWGADEEFWKQRFWYYNWHLPWIPVYRTQNQMWYNTADWDYSRAQNHFMWDHWGETWRNHDLLKNALLNAQT